MPGPCSGKNLISILVCNRLYSKENGQGIKMSVRLQNFLTKWLTKFHKRTDSNIQLSSKQWLRSMFDMSSYHGYLRRAYGIMPDANNIKAEEREAMPKAIETGIHPFTMLSLHNSLFGVCSFWNELFLKCALFGICSFWNALQIYSR